MVACEKLHIIKFKKMLFNDDIELGNFEYFYVNIYFINTLWLIFIIITSIGGHSTILLIFFK